MMKILTDGRYQVTILALLLGVSCGLFVALTLGENPLLVLAVLLRGSFGSLTNIGYTLYYATPLILTGLSVAWAFHTGLFNIGAEGQMAMGGVAIVAVAASLPELPWPLAWFAALSAAFLAGGIWGSLAGWMKAYRGCHEVLATILLNFVSYGLVGYWILGPFRNVESQVPETVAVSSAFHMPQIFSNLQGSPWNISFLVAIFFAIAVSIFLFRARLGFFQRMTGSAPKMARFAGIRPERQMVLSFFLSGGLAGLAAINEVLGYSHKVREGFMAGAGFTGIAVALLGRKSPAGIVLAAILFGALHKGSLDLDLDTAKVSRDLAQVIQGLIILGVASEPGLRTFVDFLKRRTQTRKEA